MIRFITTVSGAHIPVEHSCIIVKDSPEYIGKTLVTPFGKVVKKANSSTVGYEPHWGNCVEADKFGEHKVKIKPKEPDFFNLE